MRSALFFDHMLTPKIITIVYWLLLLAAVISGIVSMFGGYYGMTTETFFLGLATMVGGAIGARIWCELMIVLFKIHENLHKIANKSGGEESEEVTH
ncbi:DUF4282 domain-containing protein [Echinimonas agarilytica]|uniref:DUF4282 domain-containing protein n=1 Tax=Echinimonas agarilytica TaxID=1215918 RepID=A0AA42B7G7_9GAMM|nr:DUF4282 domain-containing protein [Echinimonas agarilytica]MCM2679960.1 DUF4282 domain-containing protein [Echinimonas agarilytica]